MYFALVINIIIFQVEYDHQRMTSRNIVFAVEWTVWQQKILHAYKHMYKEISEGK